MYRIDGDERAYPWGSRTAIPALRGQGPSRRPVAELWFGAHEAAPSTIHLDGADCQTLDAVIADEPATWLGQRVAEAYDDRLPFLVKLLAAAEPLSLQAHPTIEQAREGWDRENDSGIPLADARRNYKDANHKPEILIALTPFRAMAGFRDIHHTAELLRALDCSELERYIGMLEEIPQHVADADRTVTGATGTDIISDNVVVGEGTVSDGHDTRLQSLFTTWISIPVAVRDQLITSVVQSIRDIDLSSLPRWMADTFRNIQAIHARYQEDSGVLCALLLQHVSLQPGQALFLKAGELHAYLDGLGVEVMANSDNVLRGGLTSKHVDVPELIRVLNFAASPDLLVSPQARELDESAALTDWTSAHAITAGDMSTHAHAKRSAYPVPITDFTVDRYDSTAHDATWRIAVDGPCVMLCTKGSVRVSSGQAAGADTAALVLHPAEAVWADSRDKWVDVNASEDAQVFVVTC